MEESMTNSANVYFFTGAVLFLTGAVLLLLYISVFKALALTGLGCVIAGLIVLAKAMYAQDR
jgi:membrane-bound ClpP family serine protease